ncbi:MAG: hypothetical protein RO469_07435 [Thermincola sp.]|jgi:flagellar motility protein MotE (MotC chaperone)|nr:hypothetical protein [Thermincola sp.]MDT3701791.1 hypothetical protein [Thermincola sp.]
MWLKRVISTVFIVFLSLGLLVGTLWVLDYLAVWNIYKNAQQLPVIGKILPPSMNNDIGTPAGTKNPREDEINKLESENRKLQKELDSLRTETGELQKKLEIANQEKTSLNEAKNTIQKNLDALQLEIKTLKTPKVNYDSLGNYYGEMKPDAAVKIMEELSDDVVIGILEKLENDQVAKILSAMEPGRAAKLTDKMKQ